MNILTQNSSLTISSLQIAEMLASRHDKVKQSIERLSIDNEKRRAVITLPPLREVSFKDLSNRTQHTTAYMFSGEQGKRDSIIVVAQLSPQFTAALVDRWQELETGMSLAPSRLPDFTNPVVAARAWADQLEAKQAAQIELQAAQPAVNHYKAIVNRDNLLNASQVASKLGMTANAMNKLLKAMGIYDRRIVGEKVFTRKFIGDGYGVMRQTSNGYTQTMFTLAGEAWVVEKLACKVSYSRQ